MSGHAGNQNFILSGSVIKNGLVLYIDAANSLVSSSYGVNPPNWNAVMGSNGTLYNNPIWTGSFGGSLIFNGSNQYVDFGDILHFNSGDSFTINVWFNCANVYPPFASAIVSHGDYAYVPYIQSAQIWWAKARITNDYGSGITVANNIWYNLTVINNVNSNVVYYLNGVYQNTKTFAVTYDYNKNLRLGMSDSEGAYFSGSFAQLSMYNRALSSSEIVALYSGSKARFGL